MRERMYRHIAEGAWAASQVAIRVFMWATQKRRPTPGDASWKAPPNGTYRSDVRAVDAHGNRVPNAHDVKYGVNVAAPKQGDYTADDLQWRAMWASGGVGGSVAERIGQDIMTADLTHCSVGPPTSFKDVSR